MHLDTREKKDQKYSYKKKKKKEKLLNLRLVFFRKHVLYYFAESVLMYYSSEEIPWEWEQNAVIALLKVTEPLLMLLLR